jgi:excinuclease UvrABC nuclease subunit
MVQVRRLRSFLSGEDPSTIDRLKHDMDLAAQRLEFERAGSLAVIVESLEWLLEQLGRLRIAQDSYSFVYPVKGVSRQHVWFLIHGGLVVDVIPAPHRWNCPAVHIERLQRVFSQPPVQAGPRTIHENDLLRLVGSWFRTHPNELERTLSVDQAIETMNRWNTSKKTRQSGRSSRSAVVRKSA